jgi:hypothetical protein
MILRQDQTRRVGGELAERHAADVAALPQLDDEIGDRLVEREIATLRGLRQHRRLEYLAQRAEIEQRVRRDRPFVGAIGPAVVEERRASVDPQRDRDAAGAVARHDRIDVAADDAPQIAVGLRLRGGDGDRRQCGDQRACQEPHGSSGLLCPAPYAACFARRDISCRTSSR